MVTWRRGSACCAGDRVVIQERIDIKIRRVRKVEKQLAHSKPTYISLPRGMNQATTKQACTLLLFLLDKCMVFATVIQYGSRYVMSRIYDTV